MTRPSLRAPWLGTWSLTARSGPMARHSSRCRRLDRLLGPMPCHAYGVPRERVCCRTALVGWHLTRWCTAGADKARSGEHAMDITVPSSTWCIGLAFVVADGHQPRPPRILKSDYIHRGRLRGETRQDTSPQSMAVFETCARQNSLKR